MLGRVPLFHEDHERGTEKDRIGYLVGLAAGRWQAIAMTELGSSSSIECRMNKFADASTRRIP